jgi:hypothetical protein
VATVAIEAAERREPSCFPFSQEFRMNLRVSRFLPAVAALLALGSIASVSQAVPVSVDLTAVRVMQPFAEKKDASDDAYLIVTGVAKGKPLAMSKIGPWSLSRKKSADVTDKKPAALWTGDLADGEFAEVTVTLFHGKGDDAKIKDFVAKLADAEKKAAGLAAPKLASADDEKKLATDLLAAHREVITNIKKLFSRELKTDHYGGQLTMITWNNGGKIVNRLDPVGLTFGEHYGKKEKIYTKIKNTRQNVLIPDETGDLAEKWLGPVDDDEVTVRVKMLETEKRGDDEYKVCDYLVELQVKANGKPILWTLGGEKLGISDLHTYWEYATSKPEKVKK